MNRVKRNYLKMMVKFRKRNEKPFDEEQTLLYEIVSKMCARQDSKVLMAPATGSDRYYIENKANEYFIVVGGESIKITNHKFYLVRQFHYKQMEPLIQKVRRRLESDRQRIEREMFVNELDLLKNISESLDIRK